ncbi:MAG TPA: class I SAM-dependent methyltransferase [Caldilineaceae bacterium]|mgnify:FL=1|nr:class I SAM-dependent methyltransferase [Caldilineaceae bacterium]
MDELAGRMQRAYDQIAPVYAVSNSGALPANLLTLAQSVVEQCRGLGQRMVEIGCGVGRDMAWFESQGLAVTGVDLSPSMLALARSKVHGPLVVMDMRLLALATDQFAGAWCCAALLHLPKQEANLAIGELRRVLKRGALLGISVQAGEGEGWEGGYVAGVKRFFARYSVAEMTALLTAGCFVVHTATSDQVSKRQWLSFCCEAS